jgi:hypothetical protein
MPVTTAANKDPLMSLPSSLLAYYDCKALFEAALADPKGARALIGTHDACMRFRTRMHYYRSLDRKANAETYPKGHPSHGTSVCDPFVVQIMADEDGAHWIYVSPITAEGLYIEGLSSVGDLIEVEGNEVNLLEDHSNGTT